MGVEQDFIALNKKNLRILTNDDLELLWDFQNSKNTYVDSEIMMYKSYREVLLEYNQLFAFVQKKVKNDSKYLNDFLSLSISKNFRSIHIFGGLVPEMSALGVEQPDKLFEQTQELQFRFTPKSDCLFSICPISRPFWC